MKKRSFCINCPFNIRVEVPYEGNKKADILITAESPGFQEIKEKKPLIGRSGQLLNKLLDLIDLKREDVFLTNSARCMINKEEDNIKDINQALGFCRNYLKYTIKTIKPKLVIAMGAYALKQLLNKQKIMENRGTFFYSDEFQCHIFVTVHPAYVLRNSQENYPFIPFSQMFSKEKLLFEDFKQIKKFINNSYKIPVINIKNYFKVDDISTTNMKTVAFDTETSSLNLHDKNTKVLSFGFSWEEGRSEIIIL